MILKNGKRLDGMGDSMPIGSIVEYNGTDIPDGWELIEETNIGKSLISISGGGEKTYTIGAWVWTPLEFDTVIRNLGDGFEYDTETYAIKVLKDMTIKIDAQISYFGTAAGEMNVRILKNNDATNGNIAYANEYTGYTDKSGTLSIVSAITDVVADDIIQIQFSGVAGTYKINQRDFLTHITVEEISNSVISGNGAEGVETKEKNYIQCGFNEAFWIPDTNYKLLTFNNIRTNGDLFSYDNETNEVVVSETASIDEVKLHFHTMITAGGELPVEAIEVIVYKNDAIAAIINDGLDTASSRSATSLDRIVDCAPGDRFRVEARSYDNIYQMLSTYGRTLFSIEEVSNNVIIGDTETRELNTITAYSSTNVDLTAGNNIVFDTANITGSKFTLENGQIKIGAGVSKIRVSGQIWYWANNTTRQWFTLNQNETVVNQMISYNTNYETMAFSSKIIDVNEGDVFYFKLHNTEGSGGIIVNNGASPKTMTFITIEEVTNVVNSDIDIQERQTSSITAVYDPAVAGTSGNWTLPETNVSTDYPINSVTSQTGTGLTLDIENNCITVGKGISTVLVLTKITYVTNQSGSGKTWAAYITKNKANYSQATFTPNVGVHNNINNSVILNVEEGDQIRMPFYGQAGDAVGRATNTNISVIELTNNTTISEGNTGEIYSEEEQVIGTYLGKPLYRKTMIKTYTSGTSVQVIEFKPDDNVERYIKAFGTIIRPGKSNWMYPGTSDIIIYYPDSTMSYTIELKEAKTDITEIVCVMEYTKTTD